METQETQETQETLKAVHQSNSKQAECPTEQDLLNLYSDDDYSDYIEELNNSEDIKWLLQEPPCTFNENRQGVIIGMQK